MSNPRNVEQAPPRKFLIDNLEKVAGDLISYVSDLGKAEELKQLVGEVDKIYNEPRKSWVWGWLYMFYRLRTQDIKALDATFKQRSDKDSLLEGMLQFFSSGGWESTSANTALMYKIVGRLQGYADTNPEQSLTPANMERLKDLFNEQACQLLWPERFNELQKAERQDELKALGRRNIKQAADLLQITLPNSAKKDDKPKAMMVPVARGKKLDMNAFAKVESTLNSIFAKRLNPENELQQNHLDIKSEPEDAKMKFEVKKLDRSRIAELQDKLAPALLAQSAALTDKVNATPTRYVGDDESLIIPPTPSPELSEAASAAKDDLYKSEQQVYVAPEARRLTLNKEQFGAMFKLFPQAFPAKTETLQEGFIPEAPVNNMK